jgi:hypothetical protein
MVNTPFNETTATPMEGVQHQQQPQPSSVISSKDKILATIAEIENRITGYSKVITDLDPRVCSSDVTAIATVGSLSGLIGQQEQLLDTYQARLDKLNKPILPVVNDGIKSKVIPKDELPEFNPKKWVTNAQSSISFSDLDDFILQFESTFNKYSVNIDTNWYEYLPGVMKRQGDNDHLLITRQVESQKKENPKVFLPWSWARKFLKTYFEYSIAADYLGCFQKIVYFRISPKEPFINMLNRYVSVVNATQVNINSCFEIIRLFLSKLNQASPQFCEKLLLVIYKDADPSVVGHISQYHEITKDGELIQKLIPSNLNDFFCLVSKHAKYLTEEWNKLPDEKAASPSSLVTPGKRKEAPKDSPKDASRDTQARSSKPISGNHFKAHQSKRNRPWFKYGNNKKHDGNHGDSYKKNQHNNQQNKVQVNHAQVDTDDANSSFSRLSIDSEDEFLQAFNGLNDHAAEGNIKSKVYCGSINRSSYTIGDTDNPFNIDGSDTPTVTPIILQNTEVYGILDPGSEISAIRIDFANKLNIRFKPLDSKMEFINGQVCSRLRTVEPLSIEYDSIDHTVIHHFDVLENSPLLKPGYVLLGRDLIPRLGITMYSNLAHKFKNKDLKLPDDSIVDKAYIPNVSVAGTPKEQQAFHVALKPYLEANKNLNVHSFCNLPEAVVHLPTPPNQFAHVKQYPIAYAHVPKVMDEINRMLKDGVIVRAPATQWNLPITVTPKKDADGKLTKVRLVLDPRMLNKMLPIAKFPLPLIEDIFQALKNAVVYSCLDLLSAFHQFPLKESDCHKTTFTAPNGIQYMYKGTPFGLSVISPQFARVILQLLGHLPYVKCFVDDIVIFSQSVHAHFFHVKEVITLLTKANLRLNVDKCFFAKSSVYLLGYCISPAGKRIDPRKITNVMNWKELENGHQVMQFLGLINFFRKHLPNVTFFTAPLDLLCRHNPKTDGPFPWNEVHQDCFDKLKTLLSSDIVLCHPVDGVEYCLGTDASAYSISCVLFQDIEVELSPGVKQKKRNFIGFMARSLSASERRYSTTARELLAVTYALTQFHKFVFGTRIKLFTDHKALCYISTQRHMNSMLVKWQDILLNYNFEVIHIKGIHNFLPDILSRLFKPLKPEDPLGLGEGNKKSLKYRKDSAITASINRKKINDSRKLLKNSVHRKANNAKVFYIQASQAIHPDYFYPPKENHNDLLKEAHDNVGHYGAEQMVKRLHLDGIHWKRLIDDAVEFVRKCPQCQKHNIQARGYHPMQSIYSYIPGDFWHMDLGGPINTHTSSSKNNYFLVMVDSCTRFCIIKPIPNKEAATVTQQLINIFSDFGYPSVLVSDNGTEFRNKISKLLTESMGIDHRFITPLKPNTNGLAERYVQSVKKLLAKATDGTGHDWDYYVPSVQFAINNRISKRLQSSPFSLMFARKPNDIKSIDYKKDRRRQISQMTSGELLERVEFMSDIVFPAIKERTTAQSELLAAKFNNSHKTVIFKPDSYVMIRIETKNAQLMPSYTGPYLVVCQSRNGGYVLRDETGVLMPRDYPASELKAVSRDELVELTGSDKEKSYEVEAVIDHRGEGKTTEYLVRWKNYSSDWDDWLTINDFNDHEIVRKYWSRLGKPYIPKKNNVITNEPPSSMDKDDDKVYKGSVSKVLDEINGDIEQIINEHEVITANTDVSTSGTLNKNITTVINIDNQVKKTKYDQDRSHKRKRGRPSGTKNATKSNNNHAHKHSYKRVRINNNIPPTRRSNRVNVSNHHNNQ